MPTPLNFRFAPNDIRYCAEIAEAKAIIFGEEFFDRINTIRDDLGTIKDYIFIGPTDTRQDYAEQLEDLLETSSAAGKISFL